jgi:hypothetical protein
LSGKGKGNPREGIMAEQRRRAAEISEGLTTAGISAIKTMERRIVFDEKGRRKSLTIRTFQPHPVSSDLIDEFHAAGFEVFGEPDVHLEGKTESPAPDDIECCQRWQNIAVEHGLGSFGSRDFMVANFKRLTTKKGEQ